jgi:transposase
MQPEGLITMSHKELQRRDVIRRVLKQALKQSQASKMLGISVRQVKRLCRSYRQEKEKGLLSKKRGKPSNHQTDPAIKQQIISLASTVYRGFGPTLMAEKLFERNALKISKETLRKWLVQETLWKAKSPLRTRIHQSRERRDCFGELVQIDGSPHDWFEGRAAKCCLIVFIDDATSNVLYLRLEEAETTRAYFRGLLCCIQQYGIPAALYSDRHSIFRVNQCKQVEIGKTQFERACETLSVEMIHANSPQAKGRVERSNKTHQDRLVKELRLRNLSDLESANAYLESYRQEHNKRFAKIAKQPSFLFSTNTFKAEELNQILSVQTQRKLSKNLEMSFKNKIYQIQDEGKGRRLQQSCITVCETLDDTIYLLSGNKQLEYKLFTLQEKRTEITNEKTLNSVLDKKLSAKDIKKPKASHPWFHVPLSKKGTLAHQRYLEVGLANSYPQK